MRPLDSYLKHLFVIAGTRREEICVFDGNFAKSFRAEPRRPLWGADRTRAGAVAQVERHARGFPAGLHARAIRASSRPQSRSRCRRIRETPTQLPRAERASEQGGAPPSWARREAQRAGGCLPRTLAGNGRGIVGRLEGRRCIRAP